MTEPRVYLRHARQIQRPGARVLCMPGIRAWCARYGIDVNTFTLEGIAGERFIELGDALGLKALDIARREAADGQQ